MTREDLTDDTGDHAEARAIADRACGWNGSRELYRHDDTPGDPRPEWVRERLAAARAAALQRAEVWRKRGMAL